jgi:hypothetical protein
MKKNLIFIIIAIAFLATSCGPYYSEWQDVKGDMEWEQDDVKKFKVNIDASGKYDIAIGLRHINGLDEEDVNVMLKTTNPSGDTEYKSYDIKIKKGDENVGECSGDLCDIEQVVEPGFSLEEGDYTFELSPNTGADIPLVMEVGFIVDKK